MRHRLRNLFVLATLALAATAHAKGVEQGPIHRVFDAKKKAALPAFFSIGNYTYLNELEYKDLKNGVQEVLKRYPPDKHFFVGMGRDPSPVIAFLQNLGEKRLAVNLP